jgi:ABC-type branched-subunit amino acid transport system substrate-binding protein
MQTKIASAIAAACLISSATSVFAEDLVARIGQSVPLTGQQANKGKSAQHGAQLAIEELNEAGMQIGGRKLTLELDTQDDQTDPRVGVQIAQHLVDDKAIAIVGPYTSGVAMPSQNIYKTVGIPVLTIATNPAVTKQGNKNVYRVDANDGELGRIMADYAATKLNAHRAAVIDDRTAYGQGIAEEFKKAAKTKGIEIVSSEYTNDKAVDFGSILTSVKATKPNVIFYGGDAGQGGSIAKQMKKFGINAKLLGGDGICTPNLGELAGQDASIVFCARGTKDLSKTPEGVAFINKYKARFNEQPEDYAVNFYDAVMAIGNAIKTAGSTEATALNQALRASPYKGVSAVYEWDEFGDLQNPPSTVYTFVDGKMKPAN